MVLEKNANTMNGGSGSEVSLYATLSKSGRREQLYASLSGEKASYSAAYYEVMDQENQDLMKQLEIPASSVSQSRKYAPFPRGQFSLTQGRAVIHGKEIKVTTLGVRCVTTGSPPCAGRIFAHFTAAAQIEKGDLKEGREKLWRELTLVAKLVHPNLMSLLAVVTSPTALMGVYPRMCCELRLRLRSGSFSIDEKGRILFDVALGLVGQSHQRCSGVTVQPLNDMLAGILGVQVHFAQRCPTGQCAYCRGGLLSIDWFWLFQANVQRHILEP